MESSSTTSGPHWSMEDVEVGSAAVSTASFTGGHSSHRDIIKADWRFLRRRPTNPFRFFRLPTTLVISVVVMALAYLVIRCGQQFALKHPVSRHLAGAPEPGPTVSCSGGVEEGDDEEQGEKEGNLGDTELGARVEETLKSLEELAGTAYQVLTRLPPGRWIPALSMLLGFVVQELTAIAGFVDGPLEWKRQEAMRKFQAVRRRLMRRKRAIPYFRRSSGRTLMHFKLILKSGLQTPSWAPFPFNQANRKLLGDLLVMTNMGIESCRIALLAMAPSSGIQTTKPFNPGIELLRRTRNTRQRQIIANPRLCRFMEDIRQRSRRHGLYSSEVFDALAFAPKSLEENIAEFNSFVGELHAGLQQSMQLFAKSHAHPARPLAAPSNHPMAAHAPAPAHRPVQQPPASAVRQRPHGSFPSAPSDLPQQWLPLSILSLGQFSPAPPLRDPPPSQAELPGHLAPLAVPSHAYFPPGFPLETLASFPPGHLQTEPMTLKDPKLHSPFCEISAPSSLPPVPLPFTAPPYGVSHQTSPAGAPPVMPPYPFQRGTTRFPSSNQPWDQDPLFAHPPHSDVPLAPGAHRVSAPFYGHPLGDASGPGTLEEHGQAPPVNLLTEGAYEEGEKEGGDFETTSFRMHGSVADQ